MLSTLGSIFPTGGRGDFKVIVVTSGPLAETTILSKQDQSQTIMLVREQLQKTISKAIETERGTQ